MTELARVVRVDLRAETDQVVVHRSQHDLGFRKRNMQGTINSSQMQRPTRISTDPRQANGTTTTGDQKQQYRLAPHVLLGEIALRTTCYSEKILITTLLAVVGCLCPCSKIHGGPLRDFFRVRPMRQAPIAKQSSPAHVKPIEGSRPGSTGAPTVLGLSASRRSTLPVRCPPRPPVERASREHHASTLGGNLQN